MSSMGSFMKRQLLQRKSNQTPRWLVVFIPFVMLSIWTAFGSKAMLPQTVTTTTTAHKDTADFTDFEDAACRETIKSRKPHVFGKPFVPGRFPKDMNYLEALGKCNTLRCLHDARLQPGFREDMFNFPQFMVIGWAKCATTSLNKLLKEHPRVLDPPVKEPGYFTWGCNYTCGRMDCPAERTIQYVHDELTVARYIDAKGHKVAYDATPQIVSLGVKGLAAELHEIMPWLKIVMLLREPISRSMSAWLMTNVKGGGGCLKDHDMAWCLLNGTAIKYGNPKASYYSSQLNAWLDAFPPEQVFMMQYEDLVGERQEYEIKRLKEFIGIDPALSTDKLQSANCLKCNEEFQAGWPINEADYYDLIEWVSKDVDEVIRLVEEYNLGDASRWRSNWESVWKKNLSSCQDGKCSLQQ